MQNFTQEMEINSSTGQFKHKTIKKQRQPFNIEEVPNYPQENINTYLKRIPQKIPTHKHKYLQTYEDAFIDPYIYMGVLYNYSLRLLQNFRRHNLNKSQIIDRYTQNDYISLIDATYNINLDFLFKNNAMNDFFTLFHKNVKEVILYKELNNYNLEINFSTLKESSKELPIKS